MAISHVWLANSRLDEELRSIYTLPSLFKLFIWPYPTVCRYFVYWFSVLHHWTLTLWKLGCHTSIYTNVQGCVKLSSKSPLCGWRYINKAYFVSMWFGIPLIKMDTLDKTIINIDLIILLINAKCSYCIIRNSLHLTLRMFLNVEWSHLVKWMTTFSNPHFFTQSYYCRSIHLRSWLL